MIRFAPVFACTTVLVAWQMSSAPSARAANRVLLVHPAGADPFIEEIFHRVAGELRTHGFSLAQEEGARAETSPLTAQSLLARSGADACVFLDWRGDTSVVHVWVAGATRSDGGPALFEAVALQRTPEAPTILAARATDLLTAALRAPGGHGARDPTTPAAATAAGASDIATAASPAPEAGGDAGPGGGWSLGVGAALLSELAGFGAAWGPRVSAEYAFAPGTTVALRVGGPLFGADHGNAAAWARLTQAFVLADVLRDIARAGRFTLRGGAGLGLYFVRTEGAIAEGVSSIVPTRENQLAGAGAVTMEALFTFGQRWAAVFGAQALLLLPRPRIVVGHESVAFREPLLATTAGLRMAF